MIFKLIFKNPRPEILKRANFLRNKCHTLQSLINWLNHWEECTTPKWSSCVDNKWFKKQIRDVRVRSSLMGSYHFSSQDNSLGSEVFLNRSFLSYFSKAIRTEIVNKGWLMVSWLLSLLWQCKHRAFLRTSHIKFSLGCIL